VFKSKAYKHFFELFDPSIKFSAAWLATTAIWLTLRRIKQADENNRFNNYLKHREEFRSQLRAHPLLNERIHKKYQGMKGFFISNLYKSFYYSSFHEFLPIMNEKQKKKSEVFLTTINKSPLNENGIDLLNIEKDTYQRIIDLVDLEVKVIVRLIYHDIIKLRKYFDKKSIYGRERRSSPKLSVKRVTPPPVLF